MQKYTLQTARITLLILLFRVIGFSQSNTPTTVDNQPYAYCNTCSGSKWINTSNVSSLDNQYCSTTLKPFSSCYQDQCYWSRYLDCHNFGFTIPDGAAIKGIQLDVTRNCSINGAVKDFEVSLRKNNLPAGSNLAAQDFWITQNKTKTYGGTTELWGLSWSALEIDSAQFGVFIKVKNSSSSTPTVNIDEVSITVTYELATGIYEQTSIASQLTLYKNLSSGELFVNFEIQKEDNTPELNVYDIQGRKCYWGTMTNKQGNILQEKINTDMLRNGIYLISVSYQNKLYSTKFILSK
jgi:hypothetical protein